MKTTFLFFWLVLLTLNAVNSQTTQTIRGRVFEKETKQSLPGASIVLLNSDPVVGTSTNTEGIFRLQGISPGRQGLVISNVGYKTKTIQNLIVNSAHEIVLEIELEEQVYTGEAIEIKANRLNEETVNRMAAVSARTFSVEETEKYAGSRGDVARMAMNYAGVSSANDQRNDIIIRGNSPSTLLWRLEDVDIPNPNHFAEHGTTGGPVGMLNNNLLLNSDFFTGAFPAQYGNALSGVFDLRLRNGNNEKHEFLFQIGFNGFELGTEGPISKENRSSYLANFRYSTLELMDDIIDVGTSGIPKYKDLSFKLNFPLKQGQLSIFTLAGDSEISTLDSEGDNQQDLYTDEGQDLRNRSQMLASGISYTRFINSRSYLKINISGLAQKGGTLIDTLDANNNPHPNIDHNYTEHRASAGGFYHTKFNSRLSARVGFTADKMSFTMLTKEYNKTEDWMRPTIDYSKDLSKGPALLRAYLQATWRISEKLTFLPGIHYLYFSLNGSASVEPRLGVNWQLTEKQKISIGYGLHSRIQNLSTYYLGTQIGTNELIETNKELGLTKSNQWVAGYDVYLNKNTRLKTEIYYQSLFDVPVEQRSSSFSMLNTGASWGVGAQDSLVNKGSGLNYGLELTLERFFSRNIYYLATLSLFESKYKGSDKVERNTVFNGNYVLNLLIGKEFPLNERSALNLDFKLTYAGGKRYSPIDLQASQASGTTKFNEEEAFSKQFDPFFKPDIKVGYRLNAKKKKISQEWQFYVENFTNHQNILAQVYSRSENKVKNINQLGIFPMIQYRLRF